MKKHKALKIFVGATAAIVIAYIAATGLYDRHAYTKSQEMCSAIKPGMTAEKLSPLAESYGGKLLRTDNEERATAITSGWNYMCRCPVQIKENKVQQVGAPTCIS